MDNDVKFALEKLVKENKPVTCKICGGKMLPVKSGRYRCDACGNIEVDDFGKIKDFLELNGPTPITVIAMATGVETDIIELYLKRGKVEITEGSKWYLECEKCGCFIRYGRYCPDCARQLAGGIKSVFNEEVGEKPKIEQNIEMKGKMHFLNTRRN